jgi:hypothetical protein
MSRYHEDQLIQEAQGILGDDEQVLAAGYFALQDLVAAQIGGTTAGAIGGGLINETAGSALGAALGGISAKKAYAESKGVTVQLIVAVTESHIHVVNRDTDGRLGDHVASFERATCQVEIHKLGLARNIRLTDPASGACLELVGGVSPIAVTAKGDKAVLELIAA